jgi:hypothetical protein
MPKIPLYGKGLGTTVQLEAGQLSRRPDMNAFTAAGRGMMGLAETAGQIAFQFGQEQKKNTTDRLTSEMTAQAFEEAEAYNLGLQETNTEAAAAGLRDTVEKPLLNKVDGMNLTSSQKAAIKQNISRTMLTKAVDAKKVAFRNDLTLTSQARNAELETLKTQYSSTADPEMQAVLQSRANDIINQMQQRGLSSNYSINSWAKAAGLENVSVALSAATSLSDFDEISEQVKGMDLNASQRLAYQTSITQRRNILISEESDRISGEVFMADLSDDEFNDAIEQTQKGQNITIERNGEVMTISTANIPDSKLKALATSLRTSRDVQSGENERVMTDSIAKQIPDMTLSDIQELREATERGEGELGSMGLPARNVVERMLQAEISTREPKIKNEISTNSTAILDILQRSNGQPDEATQKLIADTSELYTEIGDEAGAQAFQDSLVSIKAAGAEYSALKYAPPGAIATARAELVNAKNDPSLSPRERVNAINTIKNFDAMMAARSEAITSDPAAFITSEYRKEQNDETATLSTRQLIQKQANMGIASMDIRILSNKQVLDFKNEYAGAKDYNEKSEIANKLFAQFTEDEKKVVMRNLAKQDVLSLADQLITGSPQNAKNFALDAANNPEVVKSYNEAFTAKERREFTAAVSATNTEYGSSIVGGQIGGVMSRAATDSRMLHVASMNKIVANTAMYYKMADDSLSVDDAVKMAVDNVVGSRFSFGEVNGQTFRMKKGYEGRANEMASILEKSLNRNSEKLASIIEPPEAGNLVSAQVYANEISQEGYWVTNTDNSGVYLVDKEGNMVQRKSDPEAPFSSAKDAFVMVKFEEVFSMASEAGELRDESFWFGTERKERFEAAKDIERKEIF